VSECACVLECWSEIQARYDHYRSGASYHTFIPYIPPLQHWHLQVVPEDRLLVQLTLHLYHTGRWCMDLLHLEPYPLQQQAIYLSISPTKTNQFRHPMCSATHIHICIYIYIYIYDMYVIHTYIHAHTLHMSTFGKLTTNDKRESVLAFCCVHPYHTIPYHIIPYHTIPYHTIPYHTIPYHTIPYHNIPYHTIPYLLRRIRCMLCCVLYICECESERIGDCLNLSSFSAIFI